jgi:WhiB family transcriptional regulator, redox-sensing transcriptional regulator
MDDDVIGRMLPADGWSRGSSARTSNSWMEEGGCIDATQVEFFPERGRRAAPAIEVCATCAVRQPCLIYALENEIVDGIWGGTSAEERVVLIGRTRRAARSSGATD